MEREVPLKTSIEVAHIRGVSKILERLFRDAAEIMKPGTGAADIVAFVLRHFRKNGAESAVYGYRGFQAPVCISINHVAAHGVPGDDILQNGDVCTLDCAVTKNGWYSDAAWTYLIGEGDPGKKRLIKAAWQATREGIMAARALNRVGDIGSAVMKRAKLLGTSVLRGFTGHGIGRDLHEEPSVPFFGSPGTGIPIVPGMVFTIEPIVVLGEGEVKTLRDNWTIVTANNETAAHFEQTVAVFGSYTEPLTISRRILDDYPEYPPY